MRALESFKEYQNTQDEMLLKDTIMFLHQSIELLMKEMLASHSPYLIFEELRDLPKKQTEANRLGIGIFFIDKPPRSVTYEVAIDRVEAFLNPPELDETLKQNLDRLNRLRNQLEHYAIDADKDEVVQVLEAIQEPILNLFEKHLGKLKRLHTPKVKQAMEAVDAAFNESKLLKEVHESMGKFNGQKIPGNLLGVEGEVTLPRLHFIYDEYRLPITKDDVLKSRIIDILAGTEDALGNGPGIRWIVEVKLHSPDPSFLFRFSSDSKSISALSWLVVYDEVPVLLRKKAKELNIMITGRQEYADLKRLLDFGHVDSPH